MIPNIFREFTIKRVIAKELNIKKSSLDNCRVLVVVGGNASGKSFLRRLLSAFIRQYYKDKKEEVGVVSISQEMRTSQNIGNVFVYGSEDWEATGLITCNSVVGVLRNIRENGGWGKNVIVIDEPEIGLSDETQSALAIHVREQIENWPDNLVGIVVMTHSRYFMRELNKVEGFKMLDLDGKYKTVDDWVNRKVVPVDLNTLEEVALTRFRKLTKALKKD